MSKMQQSGEWVGDKNRFLAYMQHMAQTARPAAAKRLFELFTQKEAQRIKANSVCPFPVAMQQKPDAKKGGAMKKTAGSGGKRVQFQVTAEPGSDVFVAGSFNNWDATQYRMRDNPGSGHCKTSVVLPAGRHEYKFVVNGTWCNDPDCLESVPNMSGSMNSVLTV
jgi:hypothetical protein